MALVYLSLGSNIDRERNIDSALTALAKFYVELDVSSVYESEAVGFAGDPFYNLVVGLETKLSVGELFAQLRELELDHGRLRGGAKFSSRTLDVDILTYADEVGDYDGLTLPRAEILYNAFVLRPLAEIAPQQVHPLKGKTYAELWGGYDQSKQALWPVDFSWQGRLISKSD